VADKAVNSEETDLASAVAAFTENAGADVVIDTTGSATMIGLEVPLLKLFGMLVFQGWYPPPSSLDLHQMQLRFLRTCFPCGHSGEAAQRCMQLLAFGMWLKPGGARVITLGRRPDRLEKARSMGADFAINTRDSDWKKQIDEASVGKVDGIIEATGDASLARELAGLLRPGGFASAYGVPPTGTEYASPWAALVTEEFLSFDWVLDLIRRGSVEPEDFITHTWDFDEMISAFEAVQRGDVLKGFVRINPG